METSILLFIIFGIDIKFILCTLSISALPLKEPQMTENTNKISQKRLVSVFIMGEIYKVIEARALKERRKVSQMAAIMLEDAVQAQKKAENVL